MTRFIASLAVLAGCGGEDHALTALPTGEVQGSVRDGTTLAAIADATVSLQNGSDVIEATTDANGRFALSRVPSGSTLPVDFAASGRATTRVMITINDAAGETPQSNSVTEIAVFLWPDTETIEVTVTDGSQGPPEPVAGITVLAADSNYGDVDLGATWLVDVLQATTGSDGIATLTGVAVRQRYTVWTLENGDWAAAQAESITEGATNKVGLTVYPEDFDPCCTPGNPCGLAFNGSCDCPQTWDACDCEPCQAGDPCFLSDDYECQCMGEAWDDCDCTCDGSCFGCCDVGDPCSLGSDGSCDCPAVCTWEASDCL